ncbi:MAG: radical SAM protein [Candidatus Omnitrophota bacterium]
MDARRLKFLGMVGSRLRNTLYLLARGKFRNAYCYLWSAIVTRDSGIALFDPLWRRFPALTPYPEAIEIEPTTRCHLRCVICEHTFWKEPVRDLSYAQFRQIVDQFPRLKWLGLTGIGSSFLNPDYMKMLEYAKSKGMYVEFYDTFTLVDDKIAERIIDLNIDRIWLSIEATTKETYEKIRVGANFEKVIANIKTFFEIKKRKKALLPEVWFHFIINKYNYPEMLAYVDFVAELMKDVPQAASLIFYTGLMDFKETKDLRVDNVSEELKNKIEEAAHKKGIFVNWNENISRKQCPSMCTKWSEPFILSSGHIQPCCVLNEANDREFQKNNAFMNLLEGDFRNFWRSKEFKSFLSTLKSNRFPQVCKNCKVYSTIGGKK